MTHLNQEVSTPSIDPIISAVAKVRGRDFMTVPIHNPHQEPGSRIITEDIIDTMLPGFKSRESAVWPSETKSGEILSLSRLPSETYPRGDSAHDVFFARVLIRLANQGQPVPLDVAVKPFLEPGSIRTALKDFVNSVLVTRRGFLTFDPLCAIGFEDKGLVLTVANPDIQSSDIDMADRKPYDEQVITRLQRISQLLASLHLAGIFHGDAQVRNFTVSPTSNIEAIDWESAQIVDFTKDENLEIVSDRAANDLRKLFESIVIGPDGRRKISEVSFSNYFNDVIFNPYYDFFGSHLIDYERDMGILSAIERIVHKDLSTRYADYAKLPASSSAAASSASRRSA